MAEAALQSEPIDPLVEAHARNLPVELHFRTNEGELMVVRSRVLGLEETTVELDMPHSIGHEVEFRVGMSFEGHFGSGEAIYSFRSKIRDVRKLVDLNEQRRVVGILVDRPGAIRPGQRRNDHRVPLREEEAAATIYPAHPELGGNACLIDAPSMEVRIADLSAGGAALLVENEVGRRMRMNDLFFVNLQLGGAGGEPQVALMEVRQLRELPRDGGFRVGLKMKVWPDRREAQRLVQVVQRFLTEVQRRRVKR
jgi:c-di-GMP-binding flagellar brake protein YcgR